MTASTAPLTSRLIDGYGRLLARLDALPYGWLALGIRLVLGAVLLREGLIKVENLDQRIHLFTYAISTPIPAVVAATGEAALQLAVPTALVVGFATRPAALLLLVLAVARPLGADPASWPTHAATGALLALLIFRGAGRWSVDRVIAGWLRGSQTRPQP